MAKGSRNLDLVKDLFVSNSLNTIGDSRLKKRSKSKSFTKPTPKSVFQKKFEEGVFEEFNGSDWIKYFCHKFREASGREYLLDSKTNVWNKASSMYNSITTKYGYKITKLLIDFMFDCNQHIIPEKKDIHIFVFSGGYLNSVYQNAMDWANSCYINPNNKSTVCNREWTEGAEKKITHKIRI